MKKTAKDLLPEDINLNGPFMGSELESAEAETIARNIVIIANMVNPKTWTPFSWEDYTRACNRNELAEKDVLEAFTNGGKPVWNTSAYLQPGYLEKDKGGKYHVTKKFLNAISMFAKE